MTSAPAPRSNRLPLVLAGGALLAAVALVTAALFGRAGSQVVDVIVPPGTAARIAAGEPIELLPRELRVEVGDELVVANQDDRVHEVGPYVVAPGDTIRQRFTEPGRIEGLCTLHPSGEVSIIVR